MRTHAIKHAVKRLRQVELFDSAGMPAALRSSLYWVIWGVTAGMLCFNVTGGAAWTGFQREILKANDFELGLIAAVPVAANILQILFSFIMERKRNRRFVFLFFGLIGRSLWILIGLIPFIFSPAAHSVRIASTIVLVVLISSGNSFVNLGFGSLLGDLIPMRIRGQYFSSRQRVSLVAGILSGLLVSVIVDSFGNAGYSMVLILAGLAGMADIACFLRVQWPPMAGAGDSGGETPKAMIRGVLKNKRFMTLCMFFTCWHFSVGLSSPFNNVYLIEVMHLSFLEITLFAQIVSNLTTVLSVTFWGRAIDRFGNKPVMRSVGYICMLLSGMWLFMKPGAIGLVVLFNFLSGLFWISLDLGQQNLYLSLSARKNRSVYVAVFFAMINLCGIALGNALGGALVQGVFTGLAAKNLTLGGITLNKYHYVYLLSTALRCAVMLLLFPRIEEEGSSTMAEMFSSVRMGMVRRRNDFRRSVSETRVRKKIRKAIHHESE
jgi:MFS family permease